MTIYHGNHNPPEFQRFLPMWNQAERLSKEAASPKGRQIRFRASLMLLALSVAGAIAAALIH